MGLNLVCSNIWSEKGIFYSNGYHKAFGYTAIQRQLLMLDRGCVGENCEQLLFSSDQRKQTVTLSNHLHFNNSVSLHLHLFIIGHN